MLSVTQLPSPNSFRHPIASVTPLLPSPPSSRHPAPPVTPHLPSPPSSRHPTTPFTQLLPSLHPSHYLTSCGCRPSSRRARGFRRRSAPARASDRVCCPRSERAPSTGPTAAPPGGRAAAAGRCERGAACRQSSPPTPPGSSATNGHRGGLERAYVIHLSLPTIRMYLWQPLTTSGETVLVAQNVKIVNY